MHFPEQQFLWRILVVIQKIETQPLLVFRFQIFPFKREGKSHGDVDQNLLLLRKNDLQRKL